MNILGGQALVEQLFSKHIVSDPSDLYRLDPGSLTLLENWGEKSTTNLLGSIEASKNVPFHRFLFALGIPLVGETTAKYLASHFGSLDALRNASVEELTEAPEIGKKIATSIRDFFENQWISIMIEKLRAAGLPFSQGAEETIRISNKLDGKRFVISGNFPRSREEIKQWIISHGGKVLSAISGNVDYLLAGEKMGPSKLEKAIKLGIKMIGIEDFLVLIGETSSEGTLFETDKTTTLF